MLPSIFVGLKPESIRCILRYLLGYNPQCCRSLLPKNFFCTMDIHLHSPQIIIYPLCAGAYILPSTTLDVAVRFCSHQTGVYLISAEGLPSMTLGVTVRLQSPQIVVCLLCVRTLLALLLSKSPLWKLVDCFFLYIGGCFPPFFFGSAFWIMCLLSLKFIT